MAGLGAERKPSGAHAAVKGAAPAPAAASVTLSQLAGSAVRGEGLVSPDQILALQHTAGNREVALLVSARLLQRDAAADIREARDTWGLNLNEERLAARLVRYCWGHRYDSALAVLQHDDLEDYNRDDVVRAMFDGSADDHVHLTLSNLANMGRDPAARRLLEVMRDEVDSGMVGAEEVDIRRLLTALLEDGVERRLHNKQRVESVRGSSSSDLDALATLFSDDSIVDGDGTPQARLRAVLAATEHMIIPGLQTGVEFGDTGFAGTQQPGGPGFRDPHPSSRNQPGHFLTAAGLRVTPEVVDRQIPLFGSVRRMVEAPPAMPASEVALRLTIGHEKAPDPLGGPEIIVDLILTGVFERFSSGPEGETEEERDERVARAVEERTRQHIEEVIAAFKRQYQATTDADIQAWNEALEQLRGGDYNPAAMEGPQSPLNRITIGTGRGNSIQDLRLSLVGYRFAEMVQSGAFASRRDAAAWLRRNLGPR